MRCENGFDMSWRKEAGELAKRKQIPRKTMRNIAVTFAERIIEACTYLIRTLVLLALTGSGRDQRDRIRSGYDGQHGGRGGS